ncbi:helix-turn-helix transcriptional regulator [Gilvimarinus sp. SDUM040013]|uniref:Helix-turn-helix transcriptional regulator n=1 Tax=Gilvimarinus gilvus TaxID=3058038 RepID=A0ABU4RV08_9GAMM|nr:helix-turn-helix transcriptional regulator [Gilvimarinus sp. SDUM040013]MDO3387914.1 helix-turn-helix transcriptional regulator [Gilvimarinus sp. SDUM040013]MDX6848715.1 helix-turn-helix transcriptional regulator [Gilvimarinus sp. SDUM040013]
MAINSRLMALLVGVNSTSDGWQRFLSECCALYQADLAFICLINHADGKVAWQEQSPGSSSAIDPLVQNSINAWLHSTQALPDSIHHWHSLWFDSAVEAVPVPAQIASTSNNLVAASATIFVRDGVHCKMVLCRRGAAFSAIQLAELTALSPYLECAAQSRYDLNRKHKTTVYLQAILEKMRVPVAMFNHHWQLVAANQSMQVLLDQKIHLAANPSGLLTVSSKQERTTTVLKPAAANKNAARPETGAVLFDTMMMPVELGRGETVQVGIDLIESVAAAQIASGAFVYVASLNHIAQIDKKVLVKLYDLTPSEASVCFLFSSNLSVQKIAGEQNKSVYTVREQLRSVFTKVGVKNQLQLVSTLASLPAIQL